MAKKSFFLFAVVLFIAAAGFNFAFAAETMRRPDRIEIKSLRAEPAKGGINISAVLANPGSETETYPSTYLVRLQETNPLVKPKNPDFSPSSLIVSAAEGDGGPDYISLKPLEEKTIDLFLPISPYAPLNDYNLIVSYVYSDGRGLGTADKIISNFGYNYKEGKLYKNGFINFDQENCYFIKSGGKKYSNTSGPIFNPDEAPKISCKLKNLGAENFFVFPRIEWKEFFVYGSPLNGRRVVEIMDQPIPFEAGEEKIVEFYLPKAERPQVYEALVSFVDEKGDIRSFNMSFRWTVAGSSARVERVSPVGEIKTNYDKGDTVKLLVGYFGSMDLYWAGDDTDVKNLSGASLIATIKDDKGNVCGENKVSLPEISDGSLQEQVVDVLLKAKCSQITYDVSLIADNQDLAKISYKELTEKTGGGLSDYGLYAKYFLLAVFVFGFLFFIGKGKKYMDKKFAIFGLLLVLGVFGLFKFAYGSVLSMPVGEADKILGEKIVSQDFSGSGILLARWSPPPPPPPPRWSPPPPPRWSPPPPPRWSPPPPPRWSPPPPPPPPPPRWSPPPPPPPPRWSPPPPINGSCASVHNSCASGASGGAREGAGFWYWGCAGVNGGSAASCSEKKPDPSVNGQCAATHYSCSAGTFSNSLESNSQWLWKCAGLKGGTTVSCSENKPYLLLGTTGAGSGTIDGAKIGTTYYPSGTSITLTAEPNDDSSFIGWTGCDSASDFTCAVSLNKAKEVKANFAVAGISPEKKLYEGTDAKNFDEIWGWGGIFEGQTATLRSYWGGGESSYNTFASGNIAVDFDNFLDSGIAGNPMIYLEDISGRIGCSNANSSAQIKIAIGAEGLDETEIRFKKNNAGDSDYAKQIKLNLDNLYTGEHAKNISFEKSYKYQLNPADLTGFYTDTNNGKILKSNPYIVVYFRTAGYPGSWSDSKKFYRGFFSETDSREKLGSSVKHKYGSESKALEKSGVIRVKIPLRLPDPKVDLKGASVGQSYGDGPVAVSYGCPLNLQWENSGVNTCTASSTASKDGWSGLLVKDVGKNLDLKLKSGTKMLSDIQKTGDYSLTCSRYLGSSLGTAEKKDTVKVTASQKPTVILQAKNLTTPGVYTDGTLPINKGDKIELNWSASNASACKLYRLVGSKRANEALKGTIGTLTINGLSESAVYEMECFNTYVQDSSTRVCSGSKTSDTITIKVLDEEPPPPTNLTAKPDCDNEKIAVTWDDTASVADDEDGYYKIYRNSKSADPKYRSYVYSDGDVSEDSSYTYSVYACNANGCSKPTSASATYSCQTDTPTFSSSSSGDGTITTTPGTPDNPVNPVLPSSSSSSSEDNTVTAPPESPGTGNPVSSLSFSSSSSGGSGSSSSAGDEILNVNPQSSQSVELSASETLRASIVENLPANSNKIIITVSSSDYEGPLTLSANIAQTGLSGAAAEFSPGETMDVTSGSQQYAEFRVKSIPASKSAGIYPWEIPATDQDGNKYPLTVNLNLEKTTVEWREI